MGLWTESAVCEHRPKVREHPVMSVPFVSIIVPVLNESVLIRAFLEHVRAVAPSAEIVVVDGGSDDGTPELSAGLADRVLKVSRGRARQMNAGARVARGEVFWFLHADSVIPPNALEEIAKILHEDSNVGGCFRLRLPGREWIYRVSDSLGNVGVQVFGFALGDHGIFCRRRAFLSAGKFPEVPLMEDAEFYRSLRRCGGCVNCGWRLLAASAGMSSWVPIAPPSTMPSFLGYTSSGRE